MKLCKNRAQSHLSSQLVQLLSQRQLGVEYHQLLRGNTLVSGCDFAHWRTLKIDASMGQLYWRDLLSTQVLETKSATGSSLYRSFVC